MRATLSAFTMAVLALASGAALAGPVPVGYTFDQGGDTGSFTYDDPGFVKLTDGVVGYKGWGINSAAPWVGWTDAQVNIDFTFAGMTAISGVNLGTTQDNPYDVVLPSFTVSQWVSGNWSQVGTLTVPVSNDNNTYYLDNTPHGFLSLTGLDIYSDKVRLTLSNNGPWMFADEVTFDQGQLPASNSQLPEPRTLALMAAGLGLMATARRRQTRQRGR